MAEEHEIVLEDDYKYVAVSPCSGPAKDEDGTVCLLEIGRAYLAPADPEADIMMLSLDGVGAMLRSFSGMVETA